MHYILMLLQVAIFRYCYKQSKCNGLEQFQFITANLIKNEITALLQSIR